MEVFQEHAERYHDPLIENFKEIAEKYTPKYVSNLKIELNLYKPKKDVIINMLAINIKFTAQIAVTKTTCVGKIVSIWNILFDAGLFFG